MFWPQKVIFFFCILFSMKVATREKILNLREAIGEGECARRSRLVIERLKAQPEFKKAKGVMCYVSFRREVHTHELIRELLSEGEKRVSVPLSNFANREISPREIKDFDSDLEEGPLDILEPKPRTNAVPLKEIGLVVVPGVAFDSCGNRIGYGAGFYDRFLASLPANIPVIALAFDLQIVDVAHCEAHDCTVDKIITEKRVIECKSR